MSLISNSQRVNSKNRNHSMKKEELHLRILKQQVSIMQMPKQLLKMQSFSLKKPELLLLLTGLLLICLIIPRDQVKTGSNIVKIMDYQIMYMDVQLPEKYISIIKPGQTVKLTNYTIPKDTIIGNITQLSPAINADTRTFKGNILINNPNYLLRPGMFVKADIVTNHKDSVIVIPKSIILSRQRGKTVFIVDRSGLAAERIIETGLENITDVEVTRGLLKNERVVTSGFETLSNRSKVKIIK